MQYIRRIHIVLAYTIGDETCFFHPHFHFLCHGDTMCRCVRIGYILAKKKTVESGLLEDEGEKAGEEVKKKKKEEEEKKKQTNKKTIL